MARYATQLSSLLMWGFARVIFFSARLIVDDDGISLKQNTFGVRDSYMSFDEWTTSEACSPRHYEIMHKSLRGEIGD